MIFLHDIVGLCDTEEKPGCETREADQGQCGGAPDQEADTTATGGGAAPDTRLRRSRMRLRVGPGHLSEREENRQEEPGNDIYSGAVRFLKTFSTSLFRSFICFLLVFLSYNFRHLGTQLQAWWGCFWHRKAYQNWKTSKINSCKGQSVVPKSNLVRDWPYMTTYSFGPSWTRYPLCHSVIIIWATRYLMYLYDIING